MTQGFSFLKMYNILYKFTWGRWVDFWWALLNHDEPWKNCLHKMQWLFKQNVTQAQKNWFHQKGVLDSSSSPAWYVLVGLSIRISGVTGFPIVIVCIVINLFIFRFVLQVESGMVGFRDYIEEFWVSSFGEVVTAYPSDILCVIGSM